MGLDFVGCDAHWSYSGFNSFRTDLAREIGITLDKMEGFLLTGKARRWSAIKDDIVPLLNHSDCDGELSPDECKKVAPRLRELMAGWDDSNYDKINGILLADGMDECVRLNEALVFH